jgi:hypothetical protein
MGAPVPAGTGPAALCAVPDLTCHRRDRRRVQPSGLAAACIEDGRCAHRCPVQRPGAVIASAGGLPRARLGPIHAPTTAKARRQKRTRWIPGKGHRSLTWSPITALARWCGARKARTPPPATSSSPSSPRQRRAGSGPPTGLEPTARCGPGPGQELQRRPVVLLKRPQHLTDTRPPPCARCAATAARPGAPMGSRRAWNAGAPTPPAAGWNHSSSSPVPSAPTVRASSPRSALASTTLGLRRSTTRCGSSLAAPTGSTPPRPRSRW